MEILIQLLRWLLLAEILMGFAFINTKYLKIQGPFTAIFTLSSLAALTFLGGLAGVLLPTFYILASIGFAGGIYALWCYYKSDLTIIGLLRKSPALSVVLVAIGFLAFATQLWSTEILHYDNFSHWLLVVKEILINDAFPTTENVLIEFTNYPLGSASLIYFFCKIAGNAQSVMLLAQAMLIFACFAAMFGVIHDKQRFLLTLLLATCCSMLSFYNVSIRINNLLVDFLLPMLALAAIAAIYSQRKQLDKMFIIVTPILALLVVIKSTGVFYAAVAALYMVYVVIKHCFSHSSNQSVSSILGKTFASLMASFAPLFLWNYHVSQVFAGVENKFEVSSEVAASGFGGKTAAEVEQVCQLFMEMLTDITLRPTQGLLLFTLIAVVNIIIGKFILKKKWQLPKVFVAMILVVAVYYAGLLAMYLYSMPMDEAIYLAGFERYACSIVVLFGGVIAMTLTVDVENSFHYKVGEKPESECFKSINTKSIYNKSAVICAMLIFMILSSEYNGIAYNNSLYDDSIPAKLQTIVGDNWDEEVSEDSYLIYAPDSDGQVTNYMVYYMSQYYLRADKLETICLFYEDNMLNLLSQHDYLVVLESDYHQRYLMKKYFGLSGDAGIYATSDLLNQQLLEKYR